MDIHFGHNSDCSPLHCTISAEQVRNQCPADRIFGGGDDIGCASECMQWGRDEHCCRGAFEPPNYCPPSNVQFQGMCHAYQWATDDMQSITCNPAGRMIVYLGDPKSKKPWPLDG